MQIGPGKLSPEDEKACRAFFEQLGSPDFDVREQALNALVAKGTAVLPLADEFAKHRDPEVATQAKAMKQRVLTSYDGYLPTAPGLRAALRKAKVELAGHFGALQLQDAARQAGITLILDPGIKLPQLIFDFGDEPGGQPEERGQRIALETFMQRFVEPLGIGGVPRDGVYLLTTAEKARARATQRHAFNWSGLGLNRDEAERVVKALQSFFPPVSTELHAGSEVLIVRGAEEAIARAARLVALLQPASPGAIWPPTPDEPGPLSADGGAKLLQELSAPVTLALAAEDPLDLIDQLKEQHHEVFIVINEDGQVSQAPPFPKDVSGMSPLRLMLRHQPLGLVLRWLERRAKFPAEQQNDLILGYEIGPKGRLQFRVRPKAARVLDFYVGGVDVGFLYPRDARPGAESDAAVRAALLEVLEPHLALFPACDFARDLAVVRGRLLLQGQYATVARALGVVCEWRGLGKAAPPSADWKKALTARLDALVTWDGRGLSVGDLLPALRKLGQVDILLEDAPDGTAPLFTLSGEDAQLLPPGKKYPLRALFDDLAGKTGAQWRIELGAIVLTPKVKDAGTAR